MSGEMFRNFLFKKKLVVSNVFKYITVFGPYLHGGIFLMSVGTDFVLEPLSCSGIGDDRISTVMVNHHCQNKILISDDGKKFTHYRYRKINRNALFQFLFMWIRY